MLGDFVSLLRIANFPYILLQCVGAMVPEWLWCRWIFIRFLYFCPSCPRLYAIHSTVCWNVGNVYIWFVKRDWRDQLLFSHNKFNIIKQNSRWWKTVLTTVSRGSHGLWTVSWWKDLTAAGRPVNEVAEGGMGWRLRRSSLSSLRFLFYPLSLFFLFHPLLESLFAGLRSLAALHVLNFSVFRLMKSSQLLFVVNWSLTRFYKSCTLFDRPRFHLPVNYGART